MAGLMWKDSELTYDELKVFVENGEEMKEVFIRLDKEERIVWYYDGYDYDE